MSNAGAAAAYPLYDINYRRKWFSGPGQNKIGDRGVTAYQGAAMHTSISRELINGFGEGTTQHALLVFPWYETVIWTGVRYGSIGPFTVWAAVFWTSV